jgi:hypothetical protein
VILLLIQNRKVLCCFLVFISLLSLINVNVNADASSDTVDGANNNLDYVYIDYLRNSFSIATDGKASIVSGISAHNVDQVGITVYLQIYIDGAWQQVTSWTSVVNGTINGLDEIRYVVSGYYYRTIAYGYAYISRTIVENASNTSGAIYY